MKYLMIVCALVCIPVAVSAHQPRVVESRHTIVEQPEISKAYYGTLEGEPDVYTIQSPTPFDLYVGVLVPDIAGQKKDVSAVIIEKGVRDTERAVLQGDTFAWKQFFEPFGHDTYWQGPEYKAHVAAGTYEVRVWSSNNDSTYSLAIGEIEAFDLAETWNAIVVIPYIKKHFFNESPISFILSPIGWRLVVSMYVLAFIFGLVYRTVLRKMARHSVRGLAMNIGKPDRLLRAAIGVALLAWAITTSWHPLILFFSGFAIFEAIFSWCGLYAALGKNTCPLE